MTNDFSELLAKEAIKRNWAQESVKEVTQLEVSLSPSAFPEKNHQLCQSKVDLICGVSTPVVSG
jgi:hypothetical protein